MTARSLSALASRSRSSRSLISRMLQLLAVRRERARLADLDDFLLDDIGVTREQARKEAARPVWDAPARWMR